VFICLFAITEHTFKSPVRIRNRIDPPHLLVCRKKRLNGVDRGPSDETGKTEAPCHGRCGTIKIPPYSKDLSAEDRSKFCRLSTAMVMSPYKCPNEDPG
jgi:hypothetical protein